MGLGLGMPRGFRTSDLQYEPELGFGIWGFLAWAAEGGAVTGRKASGLGNCCRLKLAQACPMVDWDDRFRV